MNLSKLTRLQRIQKIKEIFRYANRPGITRKQVAVQFWLDDSALSRLLNGKLFAADVMAAGVVYNNPNSKLRNINTAVRFLIPSEVETAVNIVNANDTFESALQANPYDPLHEAGLFQWVDVMTKSLWLLRGEKLNIFQHHDYQGMTPPTLYHKREDIC